MLPDSIAGWLGAVAGTASGLLLAGVLFVGPYRQLALGGGGVVGVVPVRTLDNPAWGVAAIALTGTFVLATVAGLADGLYTDPGDVSWAGVATAVGYGPLAVAGAAAVGVAVRRAVGALPAGGPGAAAATGLVTLLLVGPAALVVGTVAAILLLVPAAAGAYAGSRLGRAARPGP